MIWDGGWISLNYIVCNFRVKTTTIYLCACLVVQRNHSWFCASVHIEVRGKHSEVNFLISPWLPGIELRALGYHIFMVIDYNFWKIPLDHLPNFWNISMKFTNLANLHYQAPLEISLYTFPTLGFEVEVAQLSYEVFVWILGLWMQVLMLGQQAIYWLRCFSFFYYINLWNLEILNHSIPK